MPGTAVCVPARAHAFRSHAHYGQERLLIADMAVAASEAAFEWTRTYVKERKAFGKTIADFQVHVGGTGSGHFLGDHTNRLT